MCVLAMNEAQARAIIINEDDPDDAAKDYFDNEEADIDDEGNVWIGQYSISEDSLIEFAEWLLDQASSNYRL